MHRTNFAVFVWVLLLLAARGGSARAQQGSRVGTEADGFGALARVRAPIPSTNGEDPTASGTTLDLSERSSALDSTEEVVASMPGAHVRREGGFGAFSSVSLRGSGAEHTSVLLGDLPLDTEDTGPFDLSLIPLALLDSVEVYRGGAPIWWSDGAIGGIIRLVPRSAERSTLGAQLTYGSFGRLELGVTSSVLRDTGAHPAFFAHVDVAHADNDYAYVDDNQTRFDTATASARSDDVTLHQRNARIDAANGMAHGAVDLAGGRLDVVLLGHERNQGIPGPLAAPTLHVQRSLTRALGAASWTTERLRTDGERKYRLQVLANGSYQDNRLTDLEGELGVSRPIAADDRWSRASARVAGSAALTSVVEPTLTANVARDDYRPSDALAFSIPPRPSGRTSESLATELRIHGELGRTRLELRPSVRVQWSQSSIWPNESTIAPVEAARRNDVIATYRVATVVAPLPVLALGASAATGARLPSILELFGDRVFEEANTQLRVEKSRTVDASAVLRETRGILRGSVELRGFALFIDDLIAYRRTAQYTVRPENVDSARVLGAELGVQGGYGRHLSLGGSLTAMKTRNQFGKDLPLRPPLQFSVRPEVSIFPPWLNRIVLFTEADYVSFVYLDPANRTFLDAYTMVSLGMALRFLEERATVSARAQNVLGTAATDVLSRPLPGFNVLVSLAVEEAVE
ncbi:MAG: TonB-dependent receptor [Polyangiales bacterium]